MSFKNTALLSLIGLIPLLGVIWKVLKEESVKCDSGYFKLPGMVQCHPWLNCKQIHREIAVEEVIGRGAVKVVQRGEWGKHSVAVNSLPERHYRDDFLHGLHMLQQLQSKLSITQLVGECQQSNIFITQFYPLGSADNIEHILNKEGFQQFDTLSARFALCEDYARIMQSLHNSEDGARVMCDSNDLNKTLSQFLLSDDFNLVLNDVDALPLVDKSRGQLVKCGHRELYGEFVAPEQLWPHEDRDFSDEEMPGYDEKVDIWKVPDVCEAFLGRKNGSGKLRLRLLSVHLRCKSVDPDERPTASDLLKEYEGVRKKLHL